MNRLKYIISAFAIAALTASFTACDDMLSMGNEDVIYADENHLTQASDTVNSFVGILAQLQKIAVRTNLFGELRGDLVKVDPSAKMSLKEISEFSVSDDNEYNSPRDYYAVINNCNYYLANADTALVEQRYNNGARQDFYPFRAEYYAVRAIRAWIYLQLGQIYGRVPVLTEPMLTLDDAAAANAPVMDLAAICDYFINDLKPYADMTKFAYPYHGNPGQKGYNGHTSSRLSVFPVSLVLGDLYLWAASIQQNPMLAREAAKCYFDYIDWVPSDGGYKVRNLTSELNTSWMESCFTTGNFLITSSSNSSFYSTTTFGGRYDECITVIAMDSSSSEGYYNELRKLYCYDHEASEPSVAPLQPSQPCIEYSNNQVYYGRYRSGTGLYAYMPVQASMLEEEMLESNALGDMRLYANLSTHTNNRGVELQTIWKSYYAQDVIIYRTGQVYLRLAEALNYAGFPKFALAILTTGLDNTVIESEVLSQLNNATDSTFVEYFNFNTNYYKTRIISPRTANLYAESNIRSGSEAYNQIGLHERGSGWSINNPYYYPPSTDVPTDSTGYPVEPPIYIAPAANTADAVLVDSLLALNSVLINDYAIPAGIELPVRENFETQKLYNDASKEFRDELIALSDELHEQFLIDARDWYRDYAVPQVRARQQVVVDSLIDVEQALETCFEGYRFGDLMRAAYRTGDDSYLSSRLAKRNPSLVGLPRSRWFISWKGQIGQ